MDEVWNLKLFETLKWRVPVNYVTNPTLSHCDICWAELETTDLALNLGKAIELETESVESKTIATVVFYENNINYKSTLPLDIPMLISTPATLYNTYTTLEAEFEPTMLIKSIYDNNIQELIGALAINDDNKCICMYVKEGPRVAPLRKWPGSPPSPQQHTPQPVPVILHRKNEKEYNIIRRTLRSWLGLDEYSARLHILCGTSRSSELRQLSGEKRSDINGRMATKADLHEVLNDDSILEYAYRGVFIPSTTILSILQADTNDSIDHSKNSGSSGHNSSMTASIDVDEVIGKDSPKPSNYYYEEIYG